MRYIILIGLLMILLVGCQDRREIDVYDNYNDCLDAIIWYAKARGMSDTGQMSMATLWATRNCNCEEEENNTYLAVCIEP